MAGSVLVEMGRLGRSVPRPDASPVEVAAWLFRKATVLEQAAAEDSGHAAALLAHAARARSRAAQLTTPTPTTHSTPTAARAA